MDSLLEWLGSTDFYEAPASTKYHHAVDGGLVIHSLETHENLRNVVKVFDPERFLVSEAEIVIVSLLHDLTKIGFYSKEKRNRKIDGRWVEVEEYAVSDSHGLGHGSGSVIRIQNFIRLSSAEAAAIRWHMGAWGDDGYSERQSMNRAMEMYPLVSMLQMADLASNYLSKK